MSSSFQPPFPDHNVNVILPVSEARGLYNSLLAAATQSCPNIGKLTTSRLEPSPDFRSATELSSSSSASSTPSPSQLIPALQLSTSTLRGSDFAAPTSRSHSDRQTRGESDEDYITPAPRRHSSEAWTPGPTESFDEFQKHMEESLPRVRQACKRLQQVLGLRNESTYEFPQVPLPPRPESIMVGSAVGCNPALKHLKGAAAGVGIQIGPSGIAPVPLHSKTNLQARGGEQRQQANIVGELPKPQPGLVEKPLTLRERLILFGKQPYGNQIKTEIRSITFHDLTPDMRTGGFKNEMLAHFEADGEGRTRIVSYEVSVPVPGWQPPVYPSNAPEPPPTERWYFVLIYVPLVTFKSGPNSKRTPTLPPNLITTDDSGRPPSSWLLFGAPCRAIRLHPTGKDHVIVRTPDGGEALRPVKRYDFDYSFNGLPNFEFMDKSELGPALGSHLDRTIGGPFLCGRNLPSYHCGKDFVTKPQIAPGGTEHDKTSLRLEDWIRWDNVANLEQEMANSWWWNECRGRFYEDRITWGRIRDAMARSCCRVVTRVENEEAQHQKQQRKEVHQLQQHQQQQQQQGSALAATHTTGNGNSGLGMMGLGSDPSPAVGPHGLGSGLSQCRR